MASSYSTRRDGAPGAGEPGPRPAIWQALRAGKVLDVSHAAQIGRCEKSSARVFLRCLVAGGVVDVVSDDPLSVRLDPASDPGPSVPRLRQDGSDVAMGRSQARMWRAMRVLKSFDLRALVAATGADERHAARYLAWLVKAGYLVATAADAWRTVPSRYTGPLAPQIARIQAVWDPNLGAVVWPSDPAEGGEE